MKKVICIVFLLVAVFTAKAQDTAEKTPRSTVQTMDLVVEIPKINPDTYQDLKGKLKRISSMSVEGFCNSDKLMFLRFSPEQYFNVLVAINEAGYAYYIKRNTSIAKGVDLCTDKTQLFLKADVGEITQ